METLFIQQNKEKKTEFKSYYVVWKLARKVINFKMKDSLNRTMQYGNEIELRTKKMGNTV